MERTFQNSGPKSNQRHQLRLAGAALLNVALFYNAQRLALWSSSERELMLSFSAGAIGATILVLLFKVLRQGTTLQRIVAIVLLFLPAAALASVIPTLWSYL